MVRINFQPYTTTQLEQIVHARLGGSNEVLSKDAVKFAAMKVSSISGDARRVLDICRCVPSPHPIYISTFCDRVILRKNRMQTDSRTRTTFQTRSANRRRERRNSKLTELAHDRVLTLALTTRANSPRRTTQMRASYRRMRDPLGGRRPPTSPVCGRVCG
jgi:hypothetical protein